MRTLNSKADTSKVERRLKLAVLFRSWPQEVLGGRVYFTFYSGGVVKSWSLGLIAEQDFPGN